MQTKIKFICNTCYKEYIRKDAYDKHILICATINRTHNNKFNQNNKIKQEFKENSYEPSNKELFIMLTNLNLKYDKLMNDYSTLKNYVDTIKNKTNIIEYLNTHCYSNLSIFQFIYNININLNDLQLLFENGYLNGITNILIKYIDSQILQNINIPIKAFTRKHQVCYINISSHDNSNDDNSNDDNSNDDNSNDDNSNDDNKYKWVLLDHDNLYKLFNIINSKILNTFTIWNTNAIKTMDYDKYSELYPIYMKKILGVSNDSTTTLQISIKNKIYNHIKNEMKI
tara:strand:+ start:1191 stop:2042 length:852 start_codon:yes stop_codon:yes gene_type:complete